MLKIPYGTSNFSEMSLEGRYYIDRTPYIEKLEALSEHYIVYLRARRFGKSLFISTLQHYYGLEYKDQFKTLFGKYHIGKHPTPLANTYLVLKMDFSRIRTNTPTNTYKDFTRNVKSAAHRFITDYRTYFDKEDKKIIQELNDPTDVFVKLIDIIYEKTPDKRVYVLVDEYDHFANELLAFDFNAFETIVSENGFVRKFYEAIKEATNLGVVHRIFITGVLPITLDSLTSGFNIAENFSVDIRFTKMMGFTKSEVQQLLLDMKIEQKKAEALMPLLKNWYDGYLFNAEQDESVFNSDMVLFFVKNYLVQHSIPEKLLDSNVASDYTKIRNLFSLDNKEIQHYEILKDIIRNKIVNAKLKTELTFELEWTDDDFISLLFYQGIITIKEKNLDGLIFKMPNFVIEQLYFQYFYQLSLEAANLSGAEVNVRDKVILLAQKNNIQPIIEHIQDILTVHAVEDRAHFNEAHVKALFISSFYNVGFFNIISELEVKKSKTKKGRIDLLLTRRPPFQPNFQFVFELKYLKKSEANQLQATIKEAKAQLRKYLNNDPVLKSLTELKSYVVIFVVNEATVIEL